MLTPPSLKLIPAAPLHSESGPSSPLPPQGFPEEESQPVLLLGVSYSDLKAQLEQEDEKKKFKKEKFESLSGVELVTELVMSKVRVKERDSFEGGQEYEESTGKAPPLCLVCPWLTQTLPSLKSLPPSAPLSTSTRSTEGIPRVVLLLRRRVNM